MSTRNVLSPRTMSYNQVCHELKSKKVSLPPLPLKSANSSLTAKSPNVTQASKINLATTASAAASPVDVNRQRSASHKGVPVLPVVIPPMMAKASSQKILETSSLPARDSLKKVKKEVEEDQVSLRESVMTIAPPEDHLKTWPIKPEVHHTSSVSSSVSGHRRPLPPKPSLSSGDSHALAVKIDAEFKMLLQEDRLLNNYFEVEAEEDEQDVGSMNVDVEEEEEKASVPEVNLPYKFDENGAMIWKSTNEMVPRVYVFWARELTKLGYKFENCIEVVREMKEFEKAKGFLEAFFPRNKAASGKSKKNIRSSTEPATKLSDMRNPSNLSSPSESSMFEDGLKFGPAVRYPTEERMSSASTVADGEVVGDIRSRPKSIQ